MSATHSGSTDRRGLTVPEFTLVAQAALLRAFREKLFSRHDPIVVDDLLSRVANRVPLRRSDLEKALEHLLAAGALESVRSAQTAPQIRLTDAGRDRVSTLGFGIRPSRNDWRSLSQCMRQVELRLDRPAAL